MLKIGDKVSENGQIGIVVNITGDGSTADVQFADGEYPIRRQSKNLKKVKENPMKSRKTTKKSVAKKSVSLKKVPEKIAKTARKAATKLYVFPKEKSYPIGDLYHARLALIYVLSASNRASREPVMMAVQEAYPQYDWASWWDKKAKKLDGVQSWDFYTEEDVAANPKVINPFTLRSELKGSAGGKKRVSNPYREVDPNDAQFQAMVQGVYESLVKKHLGKSSKTLFVGKDGKRLDEKNKVGKKTMRELLASAFAIATKKGQELGLLKKGTQEPTAKGRKLALERLDDVKHYEQNLMDYERTLELSRKQSRTNNPRPKGLLPSDPSDRIKGKELKSVAKDFFEMAGGSYGKTSRKGMSNKGAISDYNAKVRLAEFLNKYTDRNVTDPSKLQLYAKKIIEDKDMLPITAYVVERYVYLPEMIESRGQPYSLYIQAPIASYYTIEMVGPKWKFQTNVQGRYVNLFSNFKWRSPDWAGFRDQYLRFETVTTILDEQNKEQIVPKGTPMGLAALTFYPGDLNAANGFNMDAVKSATDSVKGAYISWYNINKNKKQLQFPDDCLRPEYEILDCDTLIETEVQFAVIDPIVHIGVLVRALAELFQFRNALAGLGGADGGEGRASQLDMRNVEDFLLKNNIRDDVMLALKASGVPASFSAQGVIYTQDPMFKPFQEIYEKIQTQVYKHKDKSGKKSEKLQSIAEDFNKMMSYAKQIIERDDSVGVVKALDKELVQALHDAKKKWADKIKYDKTAADNIKRITIPSNIIPADFRT